MKQFIILLILATCWGFNANGQEMREKDVPTSILTHFKKKYPDSYVYEWEWKRKKLKYKAEFIQKGKKYEAYYTSEGNWLYTETDLEPHELPQAVLDAISQSAHAGWEIDDVEEISSPTHARYFEVELESGHQKRTLYYLPEGTLLQGIIK